MISSWIHFDFILIIQLKKNEQICQKVKKNLAKLESKDFFRDSHFRTLDTKKVEIQTLDFLFLDKKEVFFFLPIHHSLNRLNLLNSSFVRKVLEEKVILV